VDPLEIHKNFGSILEKPLIATHSAVHFSTSLSLSLSLSLWSITFDICT
jgi:hypothetical protein